MDTRPGWRRTWDWVDEWRKTSSFWLAGMAAGAVAVLVAKSLVDEWTVAALYFPAGAAGLFFLVFVWRWVSMPFRDLQEVRRVGEGSTDQAEAPTSHRLATYVDDQCARLERLRDELSEASGSIEVRERWAEFVAEVYKTIRGIGTYDTNLARYVVPELNRADRQVGNRQDPAYAAERALSVTDAVRDVGKLIGNR